MHNPSRRDFLRRGSLGVASLGFGGLTLRPEAGPTAASGGADGDLPPDRELDLFQDKQNPKKLRPTPRADRPRACSSAAAPRIHRAEIAPRIDSNSASH